MKKLLALVVILVFVEPLAAADLSGVWTLDMHDAAGRPVGMVITFRQDGEKLTGDCAAEGELQLTAAGEVHGNSVKWKCTNGELIGTFDATINEANSEMKGTWETIVKGTFTATKKN